MNLDIGSSEKHITFTKEEFQQFIMKVEHQILSKSNSLLGDSPEYLAVCPLKHSFVDGAYVREIFLPKGMFFVTKIHKKTHPYFIMKGKVSVFTEDGTVHLEGPFHGITKAGTKRLIYTHEDTIWITVHVTDKCNIAEIEKEVIAKTFEDVEYSIDI